MKVRATGLLLVSALVVCCGQGRVVRLNGTAIYTDVKGKGDVVVLIHGGPGLNHSYFRPHLDPLARDFRIVYYDQRASGRSAIPSPDSISLQFFVDDLEALRQSLRAEKLNLLAHSWGTVVAVRYALAHPSSVGKIILSNPAFLSREFDMEAASLARRRTLPADSMRRIRIINAQPLGRSDYDALFRLSFKTSAFDTTHMSSLDLGIPENFPQANAALFQGLSKDAAFHHNLYDSLHKIIAPVLIISGGADILPDGHLGKLRRGLIRSSFVEFERSGHFPFIEQRDEYLRAVTRFLRGK